MTSQPSDLQLVEDVIAALDAIKPAERLLPSDSGAELANFGSMALEYAMLAEITRGTLKALKDGVLGDGQQLDEENRAHLQQHVDQIESNSRWALIPWAAERLARLLIRHVSNAVVQAPHMGFRAPTAGRGILAHRLREATTIEWLAHCPQRCELCRTACRRDLEQLRRALREDEQARRREDPVVRWTLTSRGQRNPAVEVSDGQHRKLLKGAMARLFLDVARQSPQQANWRDLRRTRLDAGEHAALNEASWERNGRRLREALGGVLGQFWQQDGVGAAWVPPPGSGQQEP